MQMLHFTQDWHWLRKSSQELQFCYTNMESCQRYIESNTKMQLYLYLHSCMWSENFDLRPALTHHSHIFEIVAVPGGASIQKVQGACLHFKTLFSGILQQLFSLKRSSVGSLTVPFSMNNWAKKIYGRSDAMFSNWYKHFKPHPQNRISIPLRCPFQNFKQGPLSLLYGSLLPRLPELMLLNWAFQKASTHF